jgi:Ser/Thr protein kinase RdoA (MazF antagonist)
MRGLDQDDHHVTNDAVDVASATESAQQLDEIARIAAVQAGIDVAELQLLRRFANAVYLVRDRQGEPAVVRVARGDGVIERTRRSIAVVRWLVEQGFPATAPLAVDQPMISGGSIDEFAVSLWRYYPQPDGEPTPGLNSLGRITRHLHELAGPAPVELPTYEPLDTMHRLVGDDDAGEIMGAEALAWLRERIADLREAYEQLDSPLGVGLIHGDIYAGNLLWDDQDVVLGDWDSVCTGAREVDLAPTFTAAERFGLPESERDAFARAYGYDLRGWSGWPVLRNIRELSTLSALIRLAPDQPEKAQELRYRMDTLRADDRRARWAVQ